MFASHLRLNVVVLITGISNYADHSYMSIFYAEFIILIWLRSKVHYSYTFNTFSQELTKLFVLKIKKPSPLCSDIIESYATFIHDDTGVQLINAEAGQYDTSNLYNMK